MDIGLFFVQFGVGFVCLLFLIFTEQQSSQNSFVSQHLGAHYKLTVSLFIISRPTENV